MPAEPEGSVKLLALCATPLVTKKVQNFRSQCRTCCSGVRKHEAPLNADLTVAAV